jgi:DNA polymerase III epsilon subunit-like protein
LNRYAVFDIETTGFRLHPDSIVEIAVVHVDGSGEITGSWDTLLRPENGEVGPTRVHGIDRAMVAAAPAFADLAEPLYALFADRIPVAHRIAQFDGRFLNAHFGWAGIETDAFTGGLCTWQLAHRHLPLAHHTLADCCGHLGIDLVDAHQALDDTIATAQLLGHFIRAGHTRQHSARVIPPRPAGAAAADAAAATAAEAFHPRRATSAARFPHQASDVHAARAADPARHA